MSKVDVEPRVSEDNIDYRGKQRSLYWSVNEDPSETVQSDREQADIESILKSHGAGTFYEHLDRAEKQFMDVNQFEDYTEVMREARRADVEFMKLPPKVRNIFHNDVAEWLDAAHDEDKADAIAEAIGVEVERAEPEKVATPEVPAVAVEPVAKEDE